MFLIYPSSARQTIIAQKGRGFVLSLCCSRKKSPTRAPNRSSIPPFPRFPSLYGRRRAARPAEVLRTKPSIKPNRKGTPKACLFAFPDAFRQRRNRQGQVCRSRPHKIPHKSQGVYLTFIPLLAPRRRDLVRRADERGISGKVSLGTFPVSKGDSVPLRGLSTESLLSADAADLRRTHSARSALRYCRRP